jgi:hypothetical protein
MCVCYGSTGTADAHRHACGDACHALYTTMRRCAVNRHAPHSRQGSRHMRRQRSAGRDSKPRTWGRLTPPQHPRAGSGGHAVTAWVMFIASVQAGGIGGVSTHAHPSAVARPASSRHLAYTFFPRGLEADFLSPFPNPQRQIAYFFPDNFPKSRGK